MFHPTIRSRVLALGGICPIFLCIGATIPELPNGCLSSAATSAASLLDRQSCKQDNSGIGSSSEVARLIHALELDGLRISFQSCDAYGFSAEARRNRGEMAIIVTVPATSDNRNRSRLAPLAHELGHAAQLRQAGSQADLYRLIPNSVDREVGADFLAGYAIRRMLVAQNVTDFASSRDLPGQFVRTGDDHGEPLLRTNAFRRGFYLVDHEQPRPVPELHLRFQTVILHQLRFERGSQ